MRSNAEGAVLTAVKRAKCRLNVRFEGDSVLRRTQLTEVFVWMWLSPRPLRHAGRISIPLGPEQLRIRAAIPHFASNRLKPVFVPT